MLYYYYLHITKCLYVAGVATKVSTAQQQQQLQYSTDSGFNQQQSTSMPHITHQNDHDNHLTSSTTTVQLLQSHGDQVLRLPEGAVRLASSATADVEMWTLPRRCLACQFHPEVDGSELFLEKIHPFLTANGRLSPEEAAASETSLRDITPRPRGIRLMMRAFMEGGTTMTSSRREEDTLSSDDTASASANSHSAGATPSSSAVFNTKQVLEVGGTKEMVEELHELVTHMRASFSAGLQSGSKEWELLKNLNDVASAKCGDMADMAVALANFSDTVREKQTEAQTALDGISDLEAHVDILSKAVDKLDVQSQKLAADAGLSDGSSLTAGWGSSLLQNIRGGSNSSTTNSK
ncbi:hypothetical protein CEUSTIGMA_g13878.t1 [Chlamydomonas eustigma]|uniref:Glutamine amidotransferase domain-containing protein n=1 Tax=Chlamydomonas eustigma TaxID=1157962 RepID=A0A250XTT8_9CHLO|nr:hypothetical protein CEUSTIGMA_g13878.t1 [Chlamydomonas eustigma]|eukprot:GAX86468.1 hypothetical protein CEUSTIGMA_g13878.t1 [Chlamydomonas eustigma]